MILISAGHHPTKPGACYEGFCEHDEAVRWVNNIVNLLGEDNAVLVPPSTLKNKLEFINNRNPTIAAEIHFNAARVWNDLNKNDIKDEGEVKNVGKGCLTLYCPGSIKGKRLATTVQEGMEQIYSRHWNGVMEGWYRMNKNFGPDRFLVKTKCPAIIIEPEFIHRKDLIQQNRDVVCASIAQALLDYTGGS